jgi:hypothetical protein
MISVDVVDIGGHGRGGSHGRVDCCSRVSRSRRRVVVVVLVVVVIAGALSSM